MPKCIQWLFSTARHDLGKDKAGNQKFGEPCKESDLDHIISLKIHPDKRTKNVQGHVEKTIEKHVEKTAKAPKDEDAKPKRMRGMSGRFFKKKEATEKEAEEEHKKTEHSDTTAAVASTKDAGQASSSAAAPEEEGQVHQVGATPDTEDDVQVSTITQQP